ncbi:M1 family aminopeptidase [Hyphomonas sp.]|uniref:M1 family metallopeptidase n=1 Tax=Hyphomonas sp. TaxID=87 RepID=UPI00391DC51D
MLRRHLASTLLAAASVLTLAACGPNLALGGGEPDIVRLQEPPAGQLPSGVTPTVYRLNIVADPAAEGFTADVEIDVTLDAPHARIWLHAQDMNILNVFARLPSGDEIPAAFTGNEAPGGVSRLDFETPLPAGNVTLVFDYEAPYNLGLAGLYKVTQGGKPYLASQMQAIDARRMVPSFDEPRFKTIWALTVTAPEGLKVISNGMHIAAEPAGDGLERHIFSPTRPIPSYLVALAVGPYDETELQWIDYTAGLRQAPIPLRGYAAAGKSAMLEEALRITHPMLMWQEDYFAEPYPYGKLDLIAAPDFAWGAMENAGAIIYRESALLIDERTSLNQRRNIFNTHAHELAHQWFGNLVTPKWWNDIWLNESFATWFSYKTMHALEPEGEWDLSPIASGLNAMRDDSLRNVRQIRNPVTSNGDINDAFDAITYSKGGSVLNMFETYLGEEAFRQGIRVHMKRFADGVADVDDFLQSLAEGSGDSAVVESFRTFILQPGIPVLQVSAACPDDGAATLEIRQSRYAPLGSQIDPDGTTWRIPFSARISTASGDQTIRQMLTAADSRIELDACPDYVMPNAGGTGYWRFALDADSAARLAAHYGELSAGEQMVYLDSLIAGFEAGSVSGETLLSGLEASTRGSAAAMIRPLGALRGYHARLDTDDRAAFSRWLETTYAPAERQLLSRPAASLTARETLLRESLTALLIAAGERPQARAQLVQRAERFIGTSGRNPDPAALQAQEVSAAIGAGVQEKGSAFAEAALSFALVSQNQAERTAILRAIAARGAPQVVADLIRQLPDTSASPSDIWSALSASFTSSADATNPGLNTGAAALAWEAFEARFDAIIEKLPVVRRQQVGAFAGGFCSSVDAGRAEAFLRSKSGQIPGYERQLALALERVALCEALKEGPLTDLAAALAAR